VVVLLGNHEVMNLLGDLRYVTSENFASYANQDSQRRLQQAYRQQLELRRQQARESTQPLPQAPQSSPEPEAAWLQQHPLGYLEQREAFGPDGKYGRWLRDHSAIGQLEGMVFLHGGISPELSGWKLEDINQRIANELRAFDRYKKYLIEQKLILPFFDLNEISAAVQADLAARQAAAPASSEDGAAPASASTRKQAQEQHHLQILQEFQKLGGWLSMNPNGPLWYRGFAQAEDAELAPQVDQLLEAYDASGFVVGHTPQLAGGIRMRLDGKLFLIDTGMLASYFEGGRPSALEIVDGKFTAIYADRRELLLDRKAEPAAAQRQRRGRGWPSHGAARDDQQSTGATTLTPTTGHVWIGAEGQPLPFQSDEEILQFLREAKVISMKEIGIGITHPRKALLERGGVRAHATFRDIEQEKNVAPMAQGRTELFFRDNYIFECAAYELSRMLGMNWVPPTVLRRIDTKIGSLQLWLEGALTETDRYNKNITPPEFQRWRQELRVMRVFDNLIYNTDRNMGNLLFDGDWNLWLIDHTRAFRRFATLINPEGITQCERGVWERLQALDESTLKTRLKPYLRDYELTALCKRRLKLIEYIQQLILERGADQVLFTFGAPPPHQPVGQPYPQEGPGGGESKRPPRSGSAASRKTWPEPASELVGSR
jgi:hypothetical protein